MLGELCAEAAERRARAQVLGTVKNALVVWLGILFLADVVTPLQARALERRRMHVGCGRVRAQGKIRAPVVTRLLTPMNIVCLYVARTRPSC